MKETREDRRPDPNPRKHFRLWQAYLWWNELVEMRKRHKLRLSSIKAGKTKMDAGFEEDIVANLTPLIKSAKKEMVAFGHCVGPIWDWVTGIKGLGCKGSSGSLVAALLAQIDDIAKFDTPSKLIRFCGYAVINGKAEHGQKGEKSHFNRRLKSLGYLINEQFIKQQTPGYVDIYYTEKMRLRRLYPDKVEMKGSPWPYKFTDQHIDRMARRKMFKIFLQHLWLKWREFEGLPVTEPYVQAVMGHTNIIQPDDLAR